MRIHLNGGPRDGESFSVPLDLIYQRRVQTADPIPEEELYRFEAAEEPHPIPSSTYMTYTTYIAHAVSIYGVRHLLWVAEGEDPNKYLWRLL